MSKTLGTFPLFIYILLGSLLDIPTRTKLYMLGFVIVAGVISLLLNRSELQAKGKDPLLIAGIFLSITILIYYFQVS